MEGSLYPNGVLIDTTVLRRTELTKAAEILRARVDWTSRGMYSGGEITINALDNTRIDVAELSGFTPNGEYIETDSDYYSIALDDYTAGVVNYVLAIYTESNTHSQPHESNGSTYPTQSHMAWRIRVLSETNYGLLADTDSNLANNAVDRSLIIGKVTAEGAGNPLTASDIYAPTAYNTINYATPTTFITLTGVTVVNVSSGTSSGDGTLTYDNMGVPATLQWTPAVGGAGVPVNITADGYYNIFDGGGTEYIHVYVVFSQLPAPAAVVNETVTITNLYYQEIPRQTAEDDLHRHMLGTGTPSPTNPHGLSSADLGEDALSNLEEHQDVMHCNGIWKGSSASIFNCAVSPGFPADQLTLVSPLAADLYYINGKKLNGLNSTTLNFSSLGAPYQTGVNFFEVYVSDAEDPGFLSTTNVPKAAFNNPRTIGGVLIVDMSESYPAGTYVLRFDNSGPAGYAIRWDNGDPVPFPATAATDRVVRCWDEAHENWVDLFINFSGTGAGDALLPAGLGMHTDNVVVTASPDWSQNLQIASIPYWYDGSGPQGRLGYSPFGAGIRRYIDKRYWGTICKTNIADRALQELIYHQNDEFEYSGVLLYRDSDYDAFRFSQAVTPSLTVTINGGHFYCRGERRSAGQTDLTLTASKTHLIYIDATDDTMRALNVTDDYAGDLNLAMAYVLGSSQYIPDIDNETHSTDTYDPPERGVILYRVVTDATSVTERQDFTRNINGPVYPWSVAQRNSNNLSGEQKSAAFDSLYAAFAYADTYINYLPQTVSTIDVKIVGFNIIEKVMTQPSGVNVYGDCQPIDENRTNLNPTTGSLTGTWFVSDYCTVDGVYLRNNVAASAALNVGSFCSIRNCYYDHNTIVTDDLFIYAINSTGITLENNDVITASGFLQYVDCLSCFTKDNIVYQDTGNTSGAGRALIDISNATLGGHLVEGNIIVSDNTGNATACVHAVASGSLIKGNLFSIGPGAGAAAEYGAIVTGNNLVINDNLIGRSGGASEVGYGITVTGGSKIRIENNGISSMGVGIYLGHNAGDELKGISVSGNALNNSFFRGITMTFSDSVTDMSIGNNTITDSTRAAGSIFGTNVEAIKVLGAGEIHITNLDICNNNINVVDSSDVSALGIDVDFSAITSGGRIHNIKVDGNNIGNVEGVAATGSIVAAGINYDCGQGDNLNLHFCDNNVKLVPNSTTTGDKIYGIQVGASSSGTIENLNIDNNDIYAWTDSDVTNVSTGILVDATSTSVVSVSNNKIKVQETGIDFEGYQAVITGNAIESKEIGIFLNYFYESIISDNVIKVYDVALTNPFSALAGSATAIYGILAKEALTYFDIKDNNIELNSSGDLHRESANIYLYNIDQVNVQGNHTSQYYLDVPVIVATNPTHIYLGYPSGVDGKWFTIKGNVIDNVTRGAAAESLSHGIFIDLVANPTNLRGDVSSNTVFFWNNGTASATIYECFQTNVTGTVITYTGNIFLDPNSAAADATISIGSGTSSSVNYIEPVTGWGVLP